MRKDENFFLSDKFKTASKKKQVDFNKFEKFTFLSEISPILLNKTFKNMCRPFEFDSAAQIIDYNWQVDMILRSS